MQDISNIKDIELMVHSFYSKVQEDDLLGPIFNGIIQDKWPEHLDKMVRFWQTILLTEHTYSGSPFGPHAKLPIGEKHFTRWRSLFDKTIQDNFAGPTADEAKNRAATMAQIFQHKVKFIQSQS